MTERKFKPEKDCKAERHNIGIVKIADGWVCYFCGTKVSHGSITPGKNDFGGNKTYKECHCDCYQPRTIEDETEAVEKWLDTPIGDEFLDPRIAEPEEGWKFRYKRNLTRTCPICFEDLNWWGEEGPENLVCSNTIECGLDESANSISHHLWRERFVGLLNQQAVEVLDKFYNEYFHTNSDKMYANEDDEVEAIYNKLKKEYNNVDRINKENFAKRKTPRELGLSPKGSGIIKRSKINPKLLKKLGK